MLRVLWSAICIATRSEMPALTMFLIAVRRRSCESRPWMPTFRQTVDQARRKDLIGCPSRWNTRDDDASLSFEGGCRGSLPPEEIQELRCEVERSPFSPLAGPWLQVHHVLVEIDVGPPRSYCGKC